MKTAAHLLLFAALGGLFALVMQPPPRPARLLVFQAVPDAFSVVEPGPPARVVRTFDCVKLGRWATRVGEQDGKLVALDATAPALVVVPLDELRRLADGGPCAAPDVVRRVPLRHKPWRGILADGQVFISYFGENLVEAYRWPDLVRTRAIDFPSPINLGLSDLLRERGALVVAASGYYCFERDCPSGRLGDPHVYVVGDQARWPFPEAVPANQNTAALYRHPATGAIYVLNAGAYEGGYGSVQRLLPGPALGPELRLPANAAPGAAYPLAPDLFAVAQFAGPHLFLIDAAADRLAAVLRLDEAGFTPVPPDAPLPERVSTEIQAIAPDPRAPDRFFLVDAKGERLVHVARRGHTLEVLGQLSLATRAFRTNPHWTVWLR